jgi:hypothetical protein
MFDIENYYYDYSKVLSDLKAITELKEDDADDIIPYLNKLGELVLEHDVLLAEHEGMLKPLVGLTQKVKKENNITLEFEQQISKLYHKTISIRNTITRFSYLYSDKAKILKKILN